MISVIVRLLLASALVFFSVAAYAEAPLTNGDVVKLVKAGLSADTIRVKIETSSVAFQTDADALVALTLEGVPDAVIRLMIERASVVMAMAPVPITPAPTVAKTVVKRTGATPVVAPEGSKLTRRFDVAIHRSQYAKCDGAELRIDAKGVHGTRCSDLDFDLDWSKVTGLCYDYGFRGTVTFQAGTDRHTVSLTTPIEAKKVIDTVRTARPAVVATECPK